MKARARKHLHFAGRLCIIVSALALAAMIGSPRVAEAHHDGQGRVGGYTFKHSSCEPNGRINVHAPVMYSAPGSTRQWAAFMTKLFYWNGSRYVAVDATPWKYAVVDQYGFDYQWVSVSGAPVYANHWFTVPYPGDTRSPVWYQLVTYFYWFADAAGPAGSISDVNPLHDNRPGAGLTQKTYSYCKFPLANDLSIIG